jgi:hypothetical protein
MRGRYLIAAAVLLIGFAVVVRGLELSGWWMILGLWIACVPVLLGLLVQDQASDRGFRGPR